MAVKKTKQGYWQVGYRDESGKCRTRSFGKGRESKKKAEAFDAEIKLKKATDKVLPAPRSEGIYLDELAQQWIAERRSMGRKKEWLNELANLLNKHFLPHLCHVPAHKITQGDIFTVIANKYPNHSQTTRNRYIGYIKSILEYGVEMEYLDKNPLRRWKKGKEPARHSTLNLTDLQKIQDYAAKRKRLDYMVWALTVAWNIPVRPGKDLFGLTYLGNVKHDRGGVEVLHRKVCKRSFIYCKPEFMLKLKEMQLRSKSGYLIEYQGRPVKDIGNGLSGIAKRAGITYPVCMYDIRHLWITTAVNSGLELSTIADMAGTSVKMILANYYEFHSAERTRAMEIMPELKASQK